MVQKIEIDEIWLLLNISVEIFDQKSYRFFKRNYPSVIRDIRFKLRGDDNPVIFITSNVSFRYDKRDSEIDRRETFEARTLVNRRLELFKRKGKFIREKFIRSY